jgi:hypothetical protein
VCTTHQHLARQVFCNISLVNFCIVLIILKLRLFKLGGYFYPVGGGSRPFHSFSGARQLVDRIGSSLVKPAHTSVLKVRPARHSFVYIVLTHGSRITLGMFVVLDLKSIHPSCSKNINFLVSVHLGSLMKSGSGWSKWKLH